MPSRRRGPLAVLALALAALVAGCGNADAPVQSASPLGDAAFTGTATAVDGTTVDLGDFADRDLVVWFWAPW